MRRPSELLSLRGQDAGGAPLHPEPEMACMQSNQCLCSNETTCALRFPGPAKFEFFIFIYFMFNKRENNIISYVLLV